MFFGRQLKGSENFREIHFEMGTQEGLNRISAVISRNEFLRASPEAIQIVLESGRLVNFLAGSKIISYGDLDDDVFFIINGSVKIFINGVERDRWSAPEVVGELAAGMPGQSRSADVVASSEGVTALRIPGGIFRKLMADYPAVREVYNNRVQYLAHAKINQLWEKPKRANLPWWVLATAASIVMAPCFWIFTPRLGIEGIEAIAASVIFGLFFWVVLMLFDPARIPLRLAWISGIGVVFLIAYASWEGEFSADPSAWHGLGFSLSFGHEYSLVEFVISVSGLIILSILSIREHRRM